MIRFVKANFKNQEDLLQILNTTNPISWQVINDSVVIIQANFAD